MAIVTISRGSASGGLLLAKGLAKKLGYDLITREEIIRGGASKFGVVEAKLEKAIVGPPVFSEEFKQDVQCRAHRDGLFFKVHLVDPEMLEHPLEGIF